MAPDSDSLHRLMRRPLLLAHCCALFPVKGITVKTSYKLRFGWLNIRSLYSLVMWVGAIFMLYIVFNAEKADDNALSLLNASLLSAIAPPLVFFPLFLHLSCKWRQFVHKWELIEKGLHGFAPLPNLELKLKLIFVMFISTRIGYILASTLLLVWRIFRCFQLHSWNDYLEAFFLLRYHKVFTVTQPSAWKYIAILVVELLTNLQWLSCSLIITSLSLILTARFRVFNNHLESFKLQLMSARYWQEMRDSYNSLTELTRLLDTLLGPLVMATFMLETLNIIIFIYWAINYVKDPVEYAVAVVGCLQVVMLNLVTQLAVSAVYEESKRPLEVFNLVPSASYCKEVQRLYEQVAADTLALTGCQFFYVTRSVILTMVSTIVTYEVVLIQFGSYEPLPSGNSSMPHFCTSWIIPDYNNHL